MTIGKLIDLGLGEVTEFRAHHALHPDIETDGEMYLAELFREQKLIMVKERQMDNSDGSEWVRPYQTKRAVYYLDDELEWEHYTDL